MLDWIATISNYLMKYTLSYILTKEIKQIFVKYTKKWINPNFLINPF